MIISTDIYGTILKYQSVNRSISLLNWVDAIVSHCLSFTNKESLSHLWFVVFRIVLACGRGSIIILFILVQLLQIIYQFLSELDWFLFILGALILWYTYVSLVNMRPHRTPVLLLIFLKSIEIGSIQVCSKFLKQSDNHELQRQYWKNTNSPDNIEILA